MSSSLTAVGLMKMLVLKGGENESVSNMKLIIALFIIISGVARGWAQSPEQNLMKYWKHRQQLEQKSRKTSSMPIPEY